jgi:hypothetical protein
MEIRRPVITSGGTHTKFCGEFIESCQKIKYWYVTKLGTFILHNISLKYASHYIEYLSFKPFYNTVYIYQNGKIIDCSRYSTLLLISFVDVRY